MSLRPFQSPVMSLLLAAGALTAPLYASAWELAGEHAVIAETRDGQRLPLGKVRFEPRGDGSFGFALEMDHTRFTDHFLSMKEFKCLEGGGEVVCHVPYPYPNPRSVTPRDYAWLEHHLMFLFKLPKEFGAKLWNGLYYRLEATPQGLVGRPQAIDLNLISAPPAQTTQPPYRPALRDDIAPGARWIERLLIE